MKRTTLAAILLAVVFGAASAAFGLSLPLIWNSPDETAVAFFADRLAATGHLWSLESYNLFANGLVHPRSIISVEGFLVPGSFYGAIFYFGALLPLVGSAAYSLGTPLLTALASLCVFFALAKLFDRPRAVIGSVLFLASPAVWYFTSRGLYPNMLFLDLAVIGLAVIFLRPWRAIAKDRGNPILGPLIDEALGLLFLGAAFLVRPTEFLWLAPILGVMIWYARKRLHWTQIILGAIIAAAFAGVLLFTNSSLYGGPMSVGYTAGSTAPGISVPALSQSSKLPSFISAPRPFILPFGFHPRAALTHLWDHLILFAWWMPALAAIGFLFTKDKKNRRRFGRAFLWTAVSVGVYYGSGVFMDSSVSQWTIGSSYQRYFLPAGVLLIPFAAEGVWLLAGFAKKYRGYVAIGLISIVVVLGGWTAYFRSPESLIPMRAELKRYESVKAYVLKETTAKDVIVTERSDKVFFPDRRVMLDLRDQKTMDELPRLAVVAGLYYYGITITDDEYPKIQGELHKRGLQMGRIKVFGNETFYSITKEKISNN